MRDPQNKTDLLGVWWHGLNDLRVAQLRLRALGAWRQKQIINEAGGTPQEQKAWQEDMRREILFQKDMSSAWSRLSQGQQVSQSSPSLQQIMMPAQSTVPSSDTAALANQSLELMQQRLTGQQNALEEKQRSDEENFVGIRSKRVRAQQKVWWQRLINLKDWSKRNLQDVRDPAVQEQQLMLWKARLTFLTEWRAKLSQLMSLAKERQEEKGDTVPVLEKLNELMKLPEQYDKEWSKELQDLDQKVQNANAVVEASNRASESSNQAGGASNTGSPTGGYRHGVIDTIVDFVLVGKASKVILGCSALKYVPHVVIAHGRGSPSMLTWTKDTSSAEEGWCDSQGSSPKTFLRKQALKDTMDAQKTLTIILRLDEAQCAELDSQRV